MTPFFFGAAQRRLFGAFHMGEGAPSAGAAVLLCNPFGQEAIRTHRLYRVLADRLARSGVAVMRFEYFGTGDSAGEDVDGELEGWSDDVVAAHQELIRRSMAGRVFWMGGRLGAAIALRTLPHLTGEVERLVVWDPVVDGEGYGRLLKTRHAERLKEVFLRNDPSWRASIDAQVDSLLAEASGFPVSPLLGDQLASLQPTGLNVPRSLELRALVDPDDASVLAWLRRQQDRGVSVHEMPMKRTFDWMEHEAAHGALVPAQALQHLLSALTP